MDYKPPIHWITDIWGKHLIHFFLPISLKIYAVIYISAMTSQRNIRLLVVSLQRLQAAGSCIQNCSGAGTRHQRNCCLCPGAPVSFHYPCAIHQGLTTLTGWKEIVPQCCWDGTSGDRLRIHVSMFNTGRKKDNISTRIHNIHTYVQVYINNNLHLRNS